MSNPQASVWMTYLYHNQRFFWLLLAVLMFVGILGCVWMFSMELWTWKPMAWLFLSFAAISVVCMKLMDSVKTGWVLAAMSMFVVLMTLGGLKWLTWLTGVDTDSFELSAFLLGSVILMTLIVSHGVHFLSAMLREMARGLFQQDAMSEALSMTHRPILLSTLTTVFGFGAAAFFNPYFVSVAWMIGLGAVMSYLAVTVVLPLVLIRYFLEFRVGHYQDRHGLSALLNRIEKQPGLVDFVVFGSAVISLVSVAGLVLGWQNRFGSMTLLSGFAAVLAASGLLVALFWGQIKAALTSIFLAGLTMVWVLGVLAWGAWFLGDVLFQELTTGGAFVLLIPLGIVLDDVIHFFERYLRARQRFMVEPYDKAKFAMKSVGRPLWVTSQVLVVGLGVLSLAAYMESWPEVWWASTVTWVATLVISFLLLVAFPSWLIRKRR